jgi:cullin-4
MMSKVQGKRPQNVDFVDLTRPSGTTAFQPGKGAKKLVIKNFRSVSRTNELVQFYDKIWEDLEAALQAIFARQQPRKPLDTLYKGVESLCQYLRKNNSEKKLSEFLRQRCEDYLNGDMAKSIKGGAGASNVEVLRSVQKYWVIWGQQLVGPDRSTLMQVLAMAGLYPIHIQFLGQELPVKLQRTPYD